MSATVDLRGQWALVTGGTRGIGHAIGLALGRAGAHVVLTHRWGSVPEDEVVAPFLSAGAPRPLVLEADVSRDEDTRAMLELVARHAPAIDLFVHNAALAPRVAGLGDYRRPALHRSIDYTTWPLVAYPQQMHAVFGRYPRQVIGVSSDGSDHFYPGYDFVAASKAVLEQLTRYLAVHLAPYGTRVNTIRFGIVATEATRAMFGDALLRYLETLQDSGPTLLDPAACGQAVLALCSGWLDAMTGQVLTVDAGSGLRNNLIAHYHATGGGITPPVHPPGGNQ